MAAPIYDADTWTDLMVAIILRWAKDAKRSEQELQKLASFLDMPAEELQCRLANGHGRMFQKQAQHRTKVPTRRAGGAPVA